MTNKQPIEDSQVLRWLLCIIDMMLIVLCMWGSYTWFGNHEASYIHRVEFHTYIAVALVCYLPATMILPPILLGRMTRVEHIVQRLFQMVLLYIFLVAGALFLIKDGAIARTLLLSFGISFYISLTAERLLCRALVRQLRRRGRNSQHAILAGNMEDLMEVYDYMLHKEYGYSVQGIFSENELQADMTLRRLGNTQDIIPYLQEHKEINAIYCTMSDISKDKLMEIYQYCENHVIRFYALPIYINSLRRNMTTAYMGSTMLLSPRQEPQNELGNRIIKRLMDIIISSIFLTTLFPIIYVIVAIIIKRQSAGPVFFIQQRSGLNGNVFGCLKFRSMHINKDSDTVQATEHDPRKFPFGDFMRRTNIDELPQFINVLMGDMSVVGPRPHMLAHTEQYSHLINKYMVRHWVKPGISGWAQVNGFRGETKALELMEKRVHADIWYIENWSFWLDLRIIYRTLTMTLRRSEKNAY